MSSLYRSHSQPGYEACTGCRLCVLPCPVWQQTRDVRLTLMGRARAVQGGAGAADVADSLAACVVCGACEPVCPEGIDTVGATLAQRAELAAAGRPVLSLGASRPRVPEGVAAPFSRGRDVLLPGAALSGHADALARVRAVLGDHVAVAVDDGRDLAFALEAGEAIPPARLDAFVASLAGARRVICAEGILVRPLSRLLPRVIGLGEALLEREPVRSSLGLRDLLVLETRAYHADRERLVRLYDALRVERGCAVALDLHRVALPTGAASLQARAGEETRVSVAEQAAWILEGRDVARIVVESIEDTELFAATTKIPAVHLAAIAPVLSREAAA